MRNRVKGFEVILGVAPLYTVHMVNMARVIEAIENVPGDGSKSVNVDVALTVVLEGAPAFVAVSSSLVTRERETSHEHAPPRKRSDRRRRGAFRR